MPSRLYRQAEYDVCIHEIRTSEIFKYMTKFVRYIIPAIVEREVGSANLEAEFYKPTLLEEIAAPIYIYDAGLPCKPCRVIINTVLLHNRMLTKKIKPGK